jgi:hypothetical protein
MPGARIRYGAPRWVFRTNALHLTSAKVTAYDRPSPDRNATIGSISLERVIAAAANYQISGMKNQSLTGDPGDFQN